MVEDHRLKGRDMNGSDGNLEPGAYRRIALTDVVAEQIEALAVAKMEVLIAIEKTPSGSEFAECQ